MLTLKIDSIVFEISSVTGQLMGLGFLYKVYTKRKNVEIFENYNLKKTNVSLEPDFAPSCTMDRKISSLKQITMIDNKKRYFGNSFLSDVKSNICFPGINFFFRKVIIIINKFAEDTKSINFDFLSI